jgi:hypothetical protein
VVIPYTIVSHAYGVNNLTKSAKRLARGLGRSRPQTLRCRNRLYRQHLADMSFHIDWQTACGIATVGAWSFAAMPQRELSNGRSTEDLS